MGRTKFSNEKRTPGDAYVHETRRFAGLVFDVCNKLPRKWQEYLLTPLFNDADRIERDVVEANKIYMNEEYLTRDQLIENLQKRIRFLDDALTTFSSFDIHFDRLMRQFDVLDTDYRATYDLVKKAIAKAQSDGDTSGRKIRVEIHGIDKDFSYTADFNGEPVPVHFTRDKKDQLLDAEYMAKRLIGERRAADQKRMRSLMAPAANTSQTASKV